jgi:hypothetical protein
MVLFASALILTIFASPDRGELRDRTILERCIYRPSCQELGCRNIGSDPSIPSLWHCDRQIRISGFCSIRIFDGIWKTLWHKDRKPPSLGFVHLAGDGNLPHHRHRTTSRTCSDRFVASTFDKFSNTNQECSSRNQQSATGNSSSASRTDSRKQVVSTPPSSSISMSRNPRTRFGATPKSSLS